MAAVLYLIKELEPIFQKSLILIKVTSAGFITSVVLNIIKYHQNVRQKDDIYVVILTCALFMLSSVQSRRFFGTVFLLGYLCPYGIKGLMGGLISWANS